MDTGTVLIWLAVGLAFFILGFVCGRRSGDQDDFPGDIPDPYAQPFLDDTREVPHA
jgi:hypothetical protein